MLVPDVRWVSQDHIDCPFARRGAGMGHLEEAPVTRVDPRKLENRLDGHRGFLYRLKVQVHAVNAFARGSTVGAQVEQSLRRALEKGSIAERGVENRLVALRDGPLDHRKESFFWGIESAQCLPGSPPGVFSLHDSMLKGAAEPVKSCELRALRTPVLTYPAAGSYTYARP